MAFKQPSAGLQIYLASKKRYTQAGARHFRNHIFYMEQDIKALKRLKNIGNGCRKWTISPNLSQQETSE